MIPLFAAAGLSLTLSLARAEEPTPEPEPARVRLVYTGGSGGVGSAKYNFESLRALDAMAGGPDLKVEELHATHGTLASGELVLWAEDRAVATAVRFLSGKDPTCEPGPQLWALQTAPETLLTEGDPAWLEALSDRAPVVWDSVRCTADGATVRVSGPPDHLANIKLFDINQFEFRRAIQGQLSYKGAAVTFTSVGRPLQELARTVTEARRLLDETPGALFADAGDWLDGASSVADGQLSLHRPTDLLAAQRLGPAALVPGNNELLAGARAFFQEIQGLGLSYVATNWSSTDPALALPASVTREVSTPSGPIRVALLGVLDPAMAAYIPALAREGVTLTDPVTALQAEVDRLRALETPPQAIVLLTTASAALQERIRRQVRGVDVLIGDPTFATLRLASDTVDLRPLPRTAKGAPVTLPMDGLATVDLYFDPTRHALARVVTTPVLAPATLPPDPELLARITAVRARVYPALDRPLLGAPVAGQALPQALWEQVVCEAVRAQTHADTVLLRALPPAPRQPGPLTEMMVADALATLDVLEVHHVPGEKMEVFLGQALGETPVTCGARPGERFPRARGRLLEDGRSYRVVTTDRTRLSSGLDAVLKNARSAHPLDRPGWRTLSNEAGAPLTLRHGALAGLRAAREQAGGTDGLVTQLTQEAPRQVAPLLLLRLDDLSVSGVRFQGVDDETFASVPETLATAPSSSALSTSADVSLAYGSARLEYDLRFRGAFGLLATAGAPATETTDDALLSTSLALPRTTWPSGGPLHLMPYSELRLDSELTPTEGNARQADLSLLVGVSAAKTMNVRAFHIGAFLNEDLGDTDGVEPGLRLDFTTFHPFGTGDVARLITLGDVAWYASTAHDDTSDLRIRATGTVKLSLPLAWWMDLSLFASGFAMQGRVPATAGWGLSHTLGVSLDAASVFEL